MLVIPADVFAHRRNQHLVAAILRGQLEIEAHRRALAGLHIALGMHARAIHNQRAGLGVEEVIAHAEALGDAPGFSGIVADGEFGAHGVRRRVQTHVLNHIGRIHEYSQPGYRSFTGPVFRPTA